MLNKLLFPIRLFQTVFLLLFVSLSTILVFIKLLFFNVLCLLFVLEFNFMHYNPFRLLNVKYMFDLQLLKNVKNPKLVF